MPTELYKEFKKENHQTIGEKDKEFDQSNYIDWLEDKLSALKYQSSIDESISDEEVISKVVNILDDSAGYLRIDKSDTHHDIRDYCSLEKDDWVDIAKQIIPELQSLFSNSVRADFFNEKVIEEIFIEGMNAQKLINELPTPRVRLNKLKHTYRKGSQEMGESICADNAKDIKSPMEILKNKIPHGCINLKPNKEDGLIVEIIEEYHNQFVSISPQKIEDNNKIMNRKCVHGVYRVWDIVKTFDGRIIQITHDEMNGLNAEDIERHATDHEIESNSTDEFILKHNPPVFQNVEHVVDKQLKQIAEDLITHSKSAIENNEDLDEVSWNYQQGVLISYNDAMRIANFIYNSPSRDCPEAFLLHLIDVAWGCAYEDGQVPSTPYAKKIIDKAFATYDGDDKKDAIDRCDRLFPLSIRIDKLDDFIEYIYKNWRRSTADRIWIKILNGVIIDNETEITANLYTEFLEQNNATKGEGKS